MPAPCAAFGCRSGYRECTGFTPDGIKITFHSFPLNNPELCEKWIRCSNPRTDFVPSKHSRICSRHFRENDFVVAHSDSNVSRRRLQQRSSEARRLRKRHLKPDAVPSIFENAQTTPRQTTMASAPTRRETEARLLELLEESFVAADRIQVNRCLLSISMFHLR